ncbi:MAG: replication initiator protein [Arizlama microvirus]|nr:MAG: replication initiator protein [Arizlama microvirus]
MSCKFPFTAYRSKSGRNYKPGDKPGYPTGAWPLAFKPEDGYADMPVVVPCGHCMACRLERARQWAIRCVHEASMHEHNCFLTLTYRDGSVPRSIDLETGEIAAGDFPSLDKRNIVLFMKRLRKEFGSGIRFLQCGEYGEKYARPHHHVLLFNFKFPDQVFHRRSGGYNLYRSVSLERLWPHGFSEIGSLTFESAAYVARYITKKWFGDDVDEIYQGRLPEYITMSRRPGIGRNWLDANINVVYPVDRLYIRPGLLGRPPKYYDKIFECYDKEEFLKVRRNRLLQASKRPVKGADRLRVEDVCLRLRLRQAPRNYERCV